MRTNLLSERFARVRMEMVLAGGFAKPSGRKVIMDVVAEANLKQSKALITVACGMLNRAKERKPVFAPDLFAPSSDCYVLLLDATKMFCEAVSQRYQESRLQRWSPEFPDFLFDHPERCGEALALVESEHFHEFHSDQVAAREVYD